ncbi:MAG: hypothetical protein V3T14_01640 [Myxococcota bacterium]
MTRPAERTRHEIAALEEERDRILEQIRAYPPPIPACDEHFNHLLERRDQIERDLARRERSVRARA